MAIDEGKLHEFLGRFIGDLGATVHAGNAVGDQLGLYKALATAGPSTPAERATLLTGMPVLWLTTSLLST